MSLPLYFALFYVFAGIDQSGNRLLLIKELPYETAAFPSFQVQPAVRLSANSSNAHMGTYSHYIGMATHKRTALQASTETQKT